MTPLRRADFEREFRRFDVYREHPFARVLEFQAPIRPPSRFDKLWLHVAAAVLTIGLISGFGWVCGVWA